jgi:hypothetical protein
MPVLHSWLSRVCDWWNKVVSRASQDLTRLALLDAAGLATVETRRVVNWVSSFATALHWVDASLVDRVRGGLPVPTSYILQQVAIKWQQCAWSGCRMQGPVRDIPDAQSRGIKMLTYKQWFGDNSFAKGQGFVYHLNSEQRVTAVARFALSCHDLAIEAGRRSRPSIPRSQRLCPFCEGAEREDEQHFLLECPTYDALRERFPDLFGEPKPMHLMTACGGNAQLWNDYADFLIRAMAIRRATLG